MVARTLGRLIASVSPRSDNYFALFNQLTACTVRGAQMLAKLSLTQDPAAFEQLFSDIQRTEGEADDVTRNIFLTLHKSFITPFDRWEIKDLAKALDDMIDCMEDIPQRAMLYGPGGFTPEMAALGQIALRATREGAGSRRAALGHAQRRAHPEDLPGNRRHRKRGRPRHARRDDASVRRGDRMRAG